MKVEIRNRLSGEVLDTVEVMDPALAMCEYAKRRGYPNAHAMYADQAEHPSDFTVLPTTVSDNKQEKIK